MVEALLLDLKAFTKDILRTIKSSLGRFLAILLIVGLGSGFYAALRLTGPDMKFAADSYYDSTNLYDIRIVSTLGVTQDDLVAVKQVEGVEDAELAYETDIIGKLNDTQIAMRVHSYDPSSSINSLLLTDGRFPANRGECVISQDCVIGIDKNVGDVIHIDEGLGQLDDIFATEDFVIVGKIRSSNYVDFASPGTTSLGNGQIDEVIYTPEDSFAEKFPYTEVFATVKGAKEMPASSDEYKTIVNSCLDKINAISGDRELARVDEIKSSAQRELDDSRAEYERSKADAESQIASAEREITDNEIKLRDSKTTLDNAFDTFNAKVDELNAAQAKISEAESALGSAKQQRDGLEAQTEQARRAVESISPDSPEYATAYTTYMTLSATLEQTNAAINNSEVELSNSKQQLEVGKTRLENSRSEYYAGIDAYNEGMDKVNAAKQELEANKRDVAFKLSDAKRKIDDAQAEIDALEYPSWLVMDRTKNQGIESYVSDADRVDGIAQVFPLIFFLVAALVALTTMTRMVDEERINIGTYKALGYTRNKIASKYLIYAGIASSIGAILGIVVLGLVLPNIIMYAYSIMYYVPSITFMPFDIGIVVLSFCAGVGITLLATEASVVASVHETPASLMRPKVDKAGTRILLERIAPLWKRLSFSRKVTMRNIFRYKKRFFMTVIGIAGCTGLLLTGFGLSDAINDIIDKQFGKTIQYNVIVNEVDDATPEQVEILNRMIANSSSVDVCEKAYEEPVLAVGDGTSDIHSTLIVPENIDSFGNVWNLRDRKTQDDITVPSSGIAVNEKLASLLGASVGDEMTVSVADDMGNATNQRHSFRIEAIFENYVSNYILMSDSTYKELYPDATLAYTTDLVKLEGDHEERSNFEELIRTSGAVKTITDNEDVISTYKRALSSVNMIVVVLVVCAGLLAFVVLCNLININITERKREIATLMVLGFNRREVETYVYREILILSIIGVLLGLVFGFFLEGFVVTSAEVDYVMFGREIHALSYLYASVITLVFAFLVMFVMRKKFDNVDMVESLKSNE